MVIKIRRMIYTYILNKNSAYKSIFIILFIYITLFTLYLTR